MASTTGKTAARKPSKSASGGSSNGSSPKAKSSSSRSKATPARTKAAASTRAKAAAAPRSRSSAARAPSRNGASSGAAKSKPAARSRKSSGSKAGRSTGARSTSARSTSKAKSASSSSPVSQAVDNVRQAAGKAKGPAVAVGAAAAGVAGGLMLKGRQKKTVLGVPVPRSLGKPSMSDLDVRGIAKTVGEASQSFAKTSKTVSKEIERAGDKAARIGKILS